ncbi:methyltransferase domain-containing protein [Streptomyces hundungensis]|uniref:methyltransferase domain-containing protein n=1 Tax=Streptomyces hundungensis TaxID=1077946 RepID=UPI0031ED0ECB
MKLAAGLADALEASGDLKTARLREAVSTTPRHNFVPRYFENSGGAPTVWVERTEADGEAWLNPIYTNSTLVTELDSAERVQAGWHGIPTSSSTQPSLTVRMLETLDIQPDDDVLDGGLGTGYQAALILKILNETHQLVACDISGTTEARERLNQQGYKAVVMPGDATTLKFNRQFNKVIFSFGLPRITPSILNAVAPGGKLLANVFGLMSGGLVLLEGKEDGTLEGRFQDDGGYFMPARHENDAERPTADLTRMSEGMTDIPISAFDDPQFKFLLAAHLPGASLQYGTEEGQSMRRLVLPDGRWGEALYSDEKGAQPLFRDKGDAVWATVEQTWTWWTGNGRPRWNQFGLTVTTDGTHRLWYLSPDGQSWTLS